MSGDIPDDVMEAAKQAYDEALEDGFRAKSIKIIARAIMAERERCAGLAARFRGYAESQAGQAHEPEAKKLAESAAGWIESAILSGDAMNPAQIRGISA